MTNDKKVVFETDWFSVEQENFDHIESLQGMPFYRIVQPDGVIILAFTDYNEIVLIQQFRPALNNYTVELPSGDKHTSEKPHEAAARELYEETGYICKELTQIGDGTNLVNRINSKFFAFLGTGATQNPDFQPEEDIRVVLKQPDEFKAMVQSGEFDNLAMLGLLVLAGWKTSSRLPNKYTF
ncbi:NUDIX hydrolase [Candidatus Latescibacterota bacterium]